MLPNFRQFPLFLLNFTSHIALQWRRQSHTAKSAKTVYTVDGSGRGMSGSEYGKKSRVKSDPNPNLEYFPHNILQKV